MVIWTKCLQSDTCLQYSHSFFWHILPCFKTITPKYRVDLDIKTVGGYCRMLSKVFSNDFPTKTSILYGEWFSCLKFLQK